MTEKRLDIILAAKDFTNRAFVGMRRNFDRLKRSAERTFTGISRVATSAFAKIGALATLAAGAGLTALVSQSFEAVDALAKTSDKLGIATEALSGFQHAASIAGVSNQQLEVGLKRMVVNIGDAAKGIGEARREIESLGLNARELAALPVDQQFLRIADAIDKTESTTKRANAAQKIFGRAGVDLINVMRGGSAALLEFREEAERLGISVSRVDAAKIEAANDAVTRMRSSFRGLFNTISIELAPVVEALAKGITEKLGGGTEKVRDRMINAMELVARAIGVVADIMPSLEFGFEQASAKANALAAGVSVALPAGVKRAADLIAGAGFSDALTGEFAKAATEAEKRSNQIASSFVSGQKRAADAFAKLRADAEAAATKTAEVVERKFKEKPVEIPVFLSFGEPSKVFGIEAAQDRLRKKIQGIAIALQRAYGAGQLAQFQANYTALANVIAAKTGEIRDHLERVKEKQEEIRQKAEQVGEFLGDRFSDAFVDFIEGSKSAAEAFKAFARSVLTDLARIAAREAVVQSVSAAGSLLFSAKGNVFDSQGVVPFARGGIVTRPTLFGFAGGTGVMGEKGPEAILPVGRGRGGRMGVDATGIGGDTYNYWNIQAIDGASVMRILTSPDARAAQRANSLQDRSLRSSFAGRRS